MSKNFLPASLRRLVEERAHGRCEYCLIHADHALLPHEPDHIIARQHGGVTTSDNLAFACFDCNRLKGPNVASIDPETGEIVPIMHPRRDRWKNHFRLEEARILPITAVGRATANLLRLNMPERLRLREALSRSGAYP